jgi:4-hydroxy-tetrahydrodipicolinate synthase/4-hydroxy-2-oxoglutarate aldolase
MQGTGVPLVTPFDADGDLDETALEELVAWVVDHGVDFLVPCGSTSEGELMTVAERARVTDVVVGAAPDDVEVLAGTGHPGFAETMTQTERAADAGADAALVVTPHYFAHDQATLEAYFREVADASPLPVYLYSMPLFTGMYLEPETVAALATHPNVHGMKDSSGDLERFQRYVAAARGADFDLLVGSGSIYAPALDVGATGGILALANVVPERASEIYRLHQGSKDGAREVSQHVVALNHATTSEHGIPGLKAAMRSRGVPAGQPRRPFRDVDAAVEAALADLVEHTLP